MSSVIMRLGLSDGNLSDSMLSDGMVIKSDWMDCILTLRSRWADTHTGN